MNQSQATPSLNDAQTQFNQILSEVGSNNKIILFLEFLQIVLAKQPTLGDKMRSEKDEYIVHNLMDRSLRSTLPPCIQDIVQLADKKHILFATNDATFGSSRLYYGNVYDITKVRQIGTTLGSQIMLGISFDSSLEAIDTPLCMVGYKINNAGLGPAGITYSPDTVINGVIYQGPLIFQGVYQGRNTDPTDTILLVNYNTNQYNIVHGVDFYYDASQTKKTYAVLNSSLDGTTAVQSYVYDVQSKSFSEEITYMDESVTATTTTVFCICHDKGSIFKIAGGYSTSTTAVPTITDIYPYLLGTTSTSSFIKPIGRPFIADYDSETGLISNFTTISHEDDDDDDDTPSSNRHIRGIVKNDDGSFSLSMDSMKTATPNTFVSSYYNVFLKLNITGDKYKVKYNILESYNLGQMKSDTPFSTSITGMSKKFFCGYYQDDAGTSYPYIAKLDKTKTL